MADINTIAKQFTEFLLLDFRLRSCFFILSYTFVAFFPRSMLTWEGRPIQIGLPFAKVQHKVETLDAQPSSSTVASLLVSVTGLLLVDDSSNPLQFSQTFQLMPEGGSYFVQNDIFRLNYGA
ncbi:NTF2-domain-containing protein [Gymnopus androsaceus JB14]|uniref:Nuclear transport factor 2 n=1 Tax=Gymnopus androsaceus JB14 TaxID=1447944 RepID=A0A6A4HBW5_9AGAR|nr:NTF2-domain-containing protein [Gymnopus androsaceus JB14]